MNIASFDLATTTRPRTASVAAAATRAKLRLRNAYAALLNRIPDPWVLPLRRAYVTAPDGSVRARVLGPLLRLLRYRHPDPHLEWFTPADDPSIRLANVDSIVVRHLYWFGLCGWEGAEVRAWQHFCARASRVLEIGANIGFYAVCGAQRAPRGAYTAVEPHPHTSRILRRNLALNGLEHVTVLEAAVVGRRTSDRATLVVPLADEDETPPGSFLQSGGELSLPGRAAYQVPVADIRDLLRGVDLLKLDVEGYEFDILNPVREHLQRERPTLFVEVLPEARKLHQLLADLARSGAYRIYAVGRAVAEVDAADLAAGRLQKKYGARDVFLLRADREPPSNESGFNFHDG